MNNVHPAISEGFQLSPQQKWLWRSQQLEPTFSYRVQGSILIEGKLDFDRLQHALQSVVDRHEILRTRFVCLPGMTLPLQVIQDPKNLAIAQHDLRHLSLSEQTTQTEGQWQQLSQQQFDFEQGDVLFASLITLSDDRHVLLLNLSAMNADGTTFVNLVQELDRAYSAGSEEQALEETLQYADIAQWQIELLESEETQARKAFWQKLEMHPLAMPKFDLQRGIDLESGFHVEDVWVEINQATIQKLTVLSETQNVPLSTILLASWQILIWRFTQQSHVVVGHVANGRNYEELNTALGLLSKTLPLTTGLENQLKFSQVLQQVNQSIQAIEQWQESFDLQMIQPEQSEQSSFLPICFEFQVFPQVSDQSDLKFSIQKLCSYTEKFSLKLSCLQQEDSLNLVLHYDAKAYNQADIQRLSEHFVVLLESAVTAPESSIAQLNLLTDRHRHQLLIDFNQTQVNFSHEHCIQQRFELQVEQTPDRVAVVFEDQQLIYRELNQRANQLAHYLQKLGVKPDVVVGICCDRSLDFIVALLGILKAGGAYLPLDPNMPVERLTQILQDAEVTVLLTQQHFTNQVNGLTRQVIYLDHDSLFAQENTQNCISQATIENLAYVIYTSGSTGAPKGVAIEHRQLLNYLDGIVQRSELPPGAHFALVSGFAADLGNTAIFPALCTGGCLHIISQQRSIDPEALSQYCRRYPIDCLKIVPSHLSALLTAADPGAILPRQRLILGGEALSWDLVQTVQKLAPHCRIFNHYGPTETTVGVLTYAIEPSDYTSETVPIGRSLPNTQVYILDSHLQPVPVGAIGEITIGGSGLARGYFNNPELTAQKFIPHPFRAKTEARLYKTGDLGRYLPDGTIEFLGRIDHQVKIRGFRIELGEIEAVLKQHVAIAEAVVVSQEDVSGEQRLVAYVLPNQPEGINKGELQNWLSAKLPDYMLPSTFVPLKTLPLTANGKIDRAALPVPDFTHTSENFAAPRTAIEQTLAEIWAEVLQLEQVGIDDNFFELGGHSLLATQVVSRLRQVFPIELPLHHVFESPKIANLAVVITEKLAEQTDEAMLAQMLAELEELSEADAQAVLEGVHS